MTLFRDLKIGEKFYLSILDKMFGLLPYTKVSNDRWNSETLMGKKRCRIEVRAWQQVLKIPCT